MPENFDIYKEDEKEQGMVMGAGGEVTYDKITQSYALRPEPEPVRPGPREKQGRDQIQIICPESGTVVTLDIEEAVNGELIVTLRDSTKTFGAQVTADSSTIHDEPYSEEQHGVAPPELATEGVCVGGVIEVPYMMKGTGAMGSSTVLPVYVTQEVFDDVLLQIYKSLEASKHEAPIDFFRTRRMNKAPEKSELLQTMVTDQNNIVHEMYHDLNLQNNDAPEPMGVEEPNQIQPDQTFNNEEGGFQK